MKTLLKNRELSAFFAIVALFAVLVALNPAYFSLQTLAMIFASSQILCLLALGATLVMLTRNIDVSVGSTVGLCAIAVGVALNNGYGLATAIAFALAIGALAGAFNGLLVVGPRASWAWRSTARGCWPLPSTVCWRPAPGSSSPRRLVLCLIRPAAAWR